MDNMPIYLEFGLRWIHFIAGITWIGLLYFFNFINGVVVKTMDGDTKKKVVPELMPRALFWFRWGAMFTFFSGFAIIALKVSAAGTMSYMMTSSWGQWITIGAMLGTVMWFNVWFIIWPAQQKIIRWVRKGEAPAEMAGLAARATTASKINTYLSAPLLFCMGAASHLPFINPLLIAVAFIVGLGLIKQLYAMAPKVGQLS